jgi:hypothetical protein
MELEQIRKILITSFRYKPEIAPRAFRTFELAEEFARRGYQVHLYIPDTATSTSDNINITKHFVKSCREFERGEREIEIIRRSGFNQIRRVAGQILRYLTGDRIGMVYGYYLQKELTRSNHEVYDLIISIGLPFYVHLATALFIRETKQRCIRIADYGDPFYFNPVHRKVFFLKYIEKWAMNYFDYISIPTKKSIGYYLHLKDEEKIKIVPQGFNLSGISISEYSVNPLPTFLYAGIFYKSIRDPDYLFSFLVSLKMDFRFIIYTRTSDEFFQRVFEKYKDKLGERIILRDSIPREALIKEMSKMDFLINVGNDNSNQVPSKVIDYAISQRPILSFNRSTFDKKVFHDFLHGKYDNKMVINAEDYDIKRVVEQFEALCEL